MFHHADFEFLFSLGWGPYFSSQLDEQTESHLIPARVTSEERQRYRLQVGPDLIVWGEVTGKTRHEAASRRDFPAVGDWVLIQVQGETHATIHRILDRKTLLLRRAAGEKNEEQVLAANVDTAFIVTSMNADFNPRRLERYLTLVRNGGVTPVLLLTKADLANSPDSFIEQAREIAPDTDIHAISSTTGTGLSSLTPYLQPGMTSVLLGSSGVGKSTLINRLLGDAVMKTSEIREDDARGRHTTTSRQLWRLASGSLVIDTPGMRELQLWDDEDGLEQTFEDVEAIVLQCRFTNCKHEAEPGCRLRDALASGELTQSRYASYLKLQGELAHQKRKVDKEALSQEKQRWKKIHKDLREKVKQKGKR